MDLLRHSTDLYIYRDCPRNKCVTKTFDGDKLLRGIPEFRKALLIEKLWSAEFILLQQSATLSDGIGSQPTQT